VPARTTASAAWREAVRASEPEAVAVHALVVEHDDLDEPVRVVDDTADLEMDGHAYTALRFDARLADDPEDQAPRAQVAIDNVGRLLTQPVHDTAGGLGATITLMEVLLVPGADPVVEWEQTLEVASSSIDQTSVVLGLGFDPLLGRPAVRPRHDPDVSPGLF